MAQLYHKIDLSSPAFPMHYDQQTRTIIGSSNSGNAAATADIFSPPKSEIPGISYCHNVMPTKNGYQSVGFRDVVYGNLPALPTGKLYKDARVIYNEQRQRVYMGLVGGGYTYMLFPPNFFWSGVADPTPSILDPAFDPDDVTVATVNGVSYIYFRGVGCFTYDGLTGLYVHHVLGGIDESKVLGLVASSGYLVAYTKGDIAWSSTLDPTDFVPSAITGAGGGKVSDIAGDILFAVPNSTGFILYTIANAVAATFTGNSQYPFKYKEIANSKGGTGVTAVAHESNAEEQYAFTKAGMQTLNSRTATTLLPEVTDMLAGKRFEDYNETTREFEYTQISEITDIPKHVKFIASRYLVISYGKTSLTHALIYDTILSKLGKVRIPHVDVIEYTGEQIEISRESIAFLQADGKIKTVNFSTGVPSEGLLILSKLQYIRSRLIELHELEVENVPLDAELDVYSLVSLDGKTISSIVDGTLAESAEGYRKYVFRTTGKNHSLVFDGYFNLVTPQITYVAAGGR